MWSEGTVCGVRGVGSVCAVREVEWSERSVCAVIEVCEERQVSVE